MDGKDTSPDYVPEEIVTQQPRAVKNPPRKAKSAAKSMIKQEAAQFLANAAVEGGSAQPKAPAKKRKKSKAKQ